MKKINNNVIHVFGLIFILILSIVLSGTNVLADNICCEDPPTNNSSAKWTVMFYCAFDNHRASEKEFTFNLLSSVGSGDDFNIVMLYDGKTNGDTAYYYVEKDLLLPLAWYEAESNMGNSQTLKNFLELSMHNYPANHYALFVGSTHGSGWQGLGCDTSGTGSSSTLSLIDMSDYKDVLQKVTNNGIDKIDVVAFNICVTGSIEAAYQMAPYANYFVANEEHGFGGDEYSDDGTPLEWNFTNFLQELKDYPDMLPENFAKSIVNTYEPGVYTNKLFNRKAPKWYPITVFETDLSATNLSKMDQLGKTITELSKDLKENMPECKKDIKTARSEVREYGKLYRKFWWLPSILYPLQLDPLGYNCFIDLYDFVEKLKELTENTDISVSCQAVMDAMDISVIAEVSLPNDPSHGLFIYFPQFKSQYDQSIWRAIGNPDFKTMSTLYESLEFSKDTGWDEFLKLYLGVN